MAGAASSIAVGSPAWYAWLEDATSFAFTSAEGGFTARKERRGASGWYWKAYRKRNGTLHRAYLGKSTDLTLDRLCTIATTLATAVAPLKDLSRSVRLLQLDGPDALGFPAAAHPEAQPAHSPPATAPLLGTKLFIPALRPQLVPRPRLLDRLQQGMLRQADAGRRTSRLRQDHAC